MNMKKKRNEKGGNPRIVFNYTNIIIYCVIQFENLI